MSEKVDLTSPRDAIYYLVRPLIAMMKRRSFLKLSAAASLGLLAKSRSLRGQSNRSQTFYVAVEGVDENPGSIDRPFATLHRAQQAVRAFRRSNVEVPVKVVVRQGTYYLGQTLTFTPEDSSTAHAPVTYVAASGEKVTLSGGRKLSCQWQARKKSKYICDLTASNSGSFSFTQLFVNGQRQLRARYPDYDPSDRSKRYISAVRAIPAGTSSPDPQPDTDTTSPNLGVIGIEFDPNTFTQKRWGKPEEAILHIFSEEDYGNLQWQIRSIDYDRNLIWFSHGGHQMGERWSTSPAAVGKGSRFFVDNVYEEMNAPQEWYLSSQSGTLYYRPEENLDLEKALIEIPVLDEIIRFQGTGERPVEYLSIDGFRFAHTETTYMKPYESSRLGNSAIYRGGAVHFEQTRNCSIQNCWFDAVGGNAVLWGSSNLAGSVTSCRFTEVGDNAVCFAGEAQPIAGDQSAAPVDCASTENLIHNCGIFGKQTAGIYISRAHRVTAAHNHIYNMPSSAICIADGVGNGHTIEHNSIQDTVQETKHHGSITAWGNTLETDHLPVPSESSTNQATMRSSEIAEAVTLRGNLIREKSGYGILLANGASRYEIYNNVTIGAALCVCVGTGRNIYNNIWYGLGDAIIFQIDDATNHDQYRHNIAVMNDGATYAIFAHPLREQSASQIDYNCLFQDKGHFSASVVIPRADKGFASSLTYTFADWQKLGFDQHSTCADPMLSDPSRLDFRLLEASPALKLGFTNFTMNQWGVTKDFASSWRNA